MERFIKLDKSDLDEGLVSISEIEAEDIESLVDDELRQFEADGRFGDEDEDVEFYVSRQCDQLYDDCISIIFPAADGNDYVIAIYIPDTEVNRAKVSIRYPHLIINNIVLGAELAELSNFLEIYFMAIKLTPSF